MARPRSRRDLGVFVRTLQAFEGRCAYSIPLGGSLTARRLRWAMNKASDELDLKLPWAVAPKNATELVLELA